MSRVALGKGPASGGKQRWHVEVEWYCPSEVPRVSRSSECRLSFRTELLSLDASAAQASTRRSFAWISVDLMHRDSQHQILDMRPGLFPIHQSVYVAWTALSHGPSILVLVVLLCQPSDGSSSFRGEGNTSGMFTVIPAGSQLSSVDSSCILFPL